MAKDIECTGPVRLHVEVALGKEPGATQGYAASKPMAAKPMASKPMAPKPMARYGK